MSDVLRGKMESMNERIKKIMVARQQQLEEHVSGVNILSDEVGLFSFHMSFL